MKFHLLHPTLSQIQILRQRMGDMTSPANEIVAGRYKDGSKIRAHIHKKRQLRLIALENRASLIISQDVIRWVRKHGY